MQNHRVKEEGSKRDLRGTTSGTGFSNSPRQTSGRLSEEQGPFQGQSLDISDPLSEEAEQSVDILKSDCPQSNLLGFGDAFGDALRGG